MRALLPLLIAILTTTLVATSDNNCPRPTTRSTAKHGSPFYCNRLALTPELRKRHFEELGPKLRTLRKNVRELKDGYEFEFPGDAATYQLLSEWAIQERLCCPFFNIALQMESEGGSLWLRLTGRPGTKEFIKVDGAAWITQ